MKRVILASFILLYLHTLAPAQELPINFEYKRETGQETGVPIFSLMPRSEAMDYDARRGSTFEALGMLTQPERDKFGLIFINVKNEYELSRRKEKGVLLRIDGEEFKIPTYLITTSSELGLLKFEAAGIQISRLIFMKLVEANDVFIRVGDVAYNLDEDNILALHYYGSEIKRDLARRQKKERVWQ
jgi:hypothetical protein